MERLFKEQQMVHDQLIRIRTNYRKDSKTRKTVSYLTNVQAKVTALQQQYADAHRSILNSTTGADEEYENPYFLGQKYMEFDDLCLEFICDLDELLSDVAQSTQPPVQPLAESSLRIKPNVVDVKLPRIELPNFDGKYEDWTTFKDLFWSLIYQKECISNVEKLHYLKCSVKGEAAQLLKAYPITDSNLELAWNTLLERYDNPNVLVNTHLRHLVSQEPVTESASSIKGLLDKTMEAVQLLEAMEIQNLWHTVVIYLAVQRLPAATRALWEQHQGNQGKLLALDDLKQFLQTRFRTLEATTFGSRSFSHASRKVQTHLAQTPSSCCECSQSHSIRNCPTFVNASATQRYELAKRHRLCLNCLAKGHMANACSSKGRCHKYKKLHHTMLHREEISGTSNSVFPSLAAESFIPQINSMNSAIVSNVLLATARIRIQGPHGSGTVRALLDQGSQASFITENVAQRFGLKRLPSNTSVMGIGAQETTRARAVVEANMETCDGSSISFRAFVLTTLTSLLPSKQCRVIDHPKLKNITLADPQYHVPGKIDVIIGADIYGKLLLPQSNLLYDGLLLQHTKLGWVLSGTTPSDDMQRSTIQSFRIEVFEQTTTDELLERFWRLEESHDRQPVKAEDELCEQFYKATTERLRTGRYMVRLPFTSEEAKRRLGNSRYIAESNFVRLERRFLRNPELKTEYSRCIQEFIDNQHLERIEQNNTQHDTALKYYLPHHAVQKDSSTTRTRIVFNASQKTSTALSLNDVLLIGPAIQNDMVSIIIKWRLWQYGYLADVTKMYLQIKMHEEDRDFQRILWRFEPHLPIDEYRFNTVTFGVTSAPFLAIRTLQELAHANADKFPDASATIINDFYVDDVLSGANTQDDAKMKIRELNQILNSAGFQLRKWVSNDPSILIDIKDEDIDSSSTTDLNMDPGHKSLGILWHPASDALTYKHNLNDTCAYNECTKRTVLSDIAKLYDPLGWISPVIIRAKCWMQKLWMKGLGWDEKLPDDMMRYWNSLRSSFRAVDSIKIPRWILAAEADEVEVHGFCDASQEAYGVAVYLVSKGQNCGQSHLILSKTKVAPIKPVTIPRLELCGAVLLSKVIRHLLGTFKERIDITRTHLWTDSKIVLAWLHQHPSKWAVFVSNRTCQILDNAPNIPWRYVPSKCNPADIASRGLEAKELSNNNLWWNGPAWLLEPSKKWPDHAHIEPTDLEARYVPKLYCHSAQMQDSWLYELINKFSTLNRLIRVLAYCQRFCQAIRKHETNQEHLLAPELDAAMLVLVLYVQKREFYDEVQSLAQDKPISKSSKLASLNPFFDSDGVLRVSGRLAYANMKFNEKFPIILPKNGNFTKLLIEHTHSITMHGDIQLMLDSLRRNFWILDARNLVKKCVHDCLNCFRTKAQTATQLMGSLPAPRVTVSRPFTHVGVDYCGPVSIKDRKGRGGRIYKGYIALFVCLAVKAVHIEVVNDLTTDAFLAAFRRFVSRRGLCTDVYSDLGTNFVGANTEMLRIAKANLKLAEYAENERINWHFNPPASPHFGGLWEAGVKSMKLHLRRTIGNVVLTYEELCTTTCQIEACLNSRPLCQVYDESSEATALTPAHFLIGDTLLSIPEPNLLDVKENYLSRWQLTQRLAQMFWQRWTKEYLSRLQQRPKWTTRELEPRIGDLCLLKDERIPSYKWPLAKITALHPGDDKLIRVVSLIKNNKHFKRNITKIALLPINER